MSSDPKWEPARNAVHKLIQLCDVMAIALNRFYQLSFRLPDEKHPSYTDERKRLWDAFFAIQRAVFPRIDTAPPNTAFRLATAAVAYLYQNGYKDETVVGDAQNWLAAVGRGLLTPCPKDPFSPFTKKFDEECDFVSQYHRTIRFRLIAALARIGQDIPARIHQRMTLMVHPWPEEGEDPITQDTLLAMVRETEPVATEPVPATSPNPPNHPGQMSPKQVPLFAHLRTQQEILDERNESGPRVGEVRNALWRSKVVEPVTAFVPRWRLAWENFATALGVNDLTQATAAFVQIDTLLAELQSTWNEAANALGRWYHEQAEPWHTAHPGMGTFGFCWSPRDTLTWLAGWTRTVPDERLDVPSPRRIPSRIAQWIRSQIPPHQFTYDSFRLPLHAVGLFEMLGSGDWQQDVFASGLSMLSAGDKEQLAAISLVMAAVILPAPEFLPAFFDSQPSASVIQLAGAIMTWSSAAIGDELRDEFRRLRDERASVTTTPTPVIAPEGVASPPLPAHTGPTSVENVATAAPTTTQRDRRGKRIGRPERTEDDPLVKQENQLYRDWKASGLTATEFLRQRGIGEKEGTKILDRARKRVEK